jgi:hypothetical protein
VANFLDAHLEGAILIGACLQGVKGLTVGQLSAVKTLDQAQLDPPFLKQIQQQYPQLLEKSQDISLDMSFLNFLFPGDR